MGIFGFVSKSGSLDPKILVKYLIQRYQFDEWKQLPNDEQTSKKLIYIDDIRTKVLNFGIGVIYRKTGQSTRKQIFSNVLSQEEEDKFDRFLRLMGTKGDSVKGNTSPDTPAVISQWKDKAISWYFGPELTKDQQRQFIGNSLAILVFNDGSDPFDPLELELGSVTCLVGVVTPVRKKFRLDFYFHYVTDNNKKYELATIPNIEIPPEIPYNYLFKSALLQDFVLAKVYNGLVISSVYHPLLRRVTFQPLSRAFENLAKLYF